MPITVVVRRKIYTVLEDSNIAFMGLNSYPSKEMLIVAAYTCYIFCAACTSPAKHLND